jgi:hypothetical protein
MTAALLITIAIVGSMISIGGALAFVPSTTITTLLTAGVKGKVQGLNSAGEFVAISGALVEASSRPSGQLLASTQTEAGGAFSLQLGPGDYDLRVSAEPPSSNISPAFIIARAVAYVTPDVVATIEGVNITLSPGLPERDVGGSCLTDSDGFCNLAVRPYYPLHSYLATVRVSEGVETPIDVVLDPVAAGDLEPSTYYVVFSHPEYPVGPDPQTNRVLKIIPGRSYSFEGYMNSWPTVTTTVVFEGNRCGIGVNGFTYSSLTAWDLRFDAERRLFNFTVAEIPNSTGDFTEFVVLIDKRLLNGSPTVFVDSSIAPSTFAQNASHYFVRFSYMMNGEVTHEVTLGGSNTIPEDSRPAVSLAISIALAYLFLRTKPGARKNNMRLKMNCLHRPTPATSLLH